MSEGASKDQGLLIDLLTRMLDCSRDMLALLDSNFCFVLVNQGYADMFGQPRAYFPGTSMETAFGHNPDHYQAAVKPLLEASKAGADQLFEQWFDVPGLGSFYLELRYLPLKDSADKVSHIVVVCRDRTDIVRSIEALQKSEQMLKRTEHIAKLGGWFFDVATGDMQWTDEMYAIHEVDRDFITSPSNSEQFMTPEDVGRVRRELEIALSGTPTSLTSRMVTAKGVPKWVRSISFPVFQDGRVEKLEGMLQDITDLMELQIGMERALRSLESHKHILDKHAILAITDTSGTFKHVNDKFLEISEYTREQLVGQHHSLMRTAIHQEEFYDQLWNSISKGQVWQGEISRKSRSGRIFWLYSTIVPLKDGLGNIEEYISVSTDLTELKLTEASLRRAQKMEAIGQLSGGIAHDFNNLLGIVVGNVELAELQIAQDHPALEPLENARNAALRGSVLTRRLLNFSRQSPLQSSVLDINRVLSGLDVLISKSLTALISVEMRLDPMIG